MLRKSNVNISNESKLQSRRRLLLVLCSSLYTFFFIGSFYGWGPMQLLLEKNKSFSWLCSETQKHIGEICPAQTSALLNVQFIAHVSQVTAPWLGNLVDRYGATRSAYLMTFCNWLGLILFLFATISLEQLLYPAFLLLAQSVSIGSILTTHTGMMFSGQTRQRVISGLNAIFDAGSITYLGLWSIGDITVISLTSIILGYFAFSVLFFGCGCYFWTVAKPAICDDSKLGSQSYSKGVEVMCVSSNPGSASSICNKESEVNLEHSQNVDSHDQADPDMLEVNPSTSKATNPLDIKQPSVVSFDDPSLVVRPSFSRLKSPTVLLLTLFFTIHGTTNHWTLTTIRDFLSYLGDDKVGNKYTVIFTITMPASLAALPLSDMIIQKFGFYGGFQTINILGLAYNSIRLLSPSLNVQILSFIIFSFFRCFLFGVTLLRFTFIINPN